MLFKLRHFAIAACAMLVMAIGLQSMTTAPDLAPAAGDAIEAPADSTPDTMASEDHSGPQPEHGAADPALIPPETASAPSGARLRGWAAVRSVGLPAGRGAAGLDRPPRRA